MYCRKCRYDLQQLGRRECPECGRAFNPGDPTTYDSAPSHRRACTAILIAGLILLGLVEKLLFTFGSELPGFFHGGDFIALIVAVACAYIAGWSANMRIAFLIYGGAFVFMLLPGCIEQSDLTDRLLAGRTEFAVWGFAAFLIMTLTWCAGRIGWRSRNALRRHRAVGRSRTGIRKWLRPRNVLIIIAMSLLITAGWLTIETLRVMYGNPRIAVDYEAHFEQYRAQVADVDPKAAARAWRDMEDALDQLELQIVQLDAARIGQVFEQRAEWDDGAIDFSYALDGQVLPPGVAREQDAIDALREAGVLEQLRRVADGPIALREVDLSDPLHWEGLMVVSAQARFAAKAMGASMRFASTEGRFEDVADAFDTTLAIAETLSHQGDVLSDLVAAAIVQLVTWELRHDLPEFEFDQDTCRRLLAIMDRRRLAPLELVMEYERAEFLDTVQRTFTDNGEGNGYALPGPLAQVLTGVSAKSGLLESFQSRFQDPSRRDVVERFEEFMRGYVIEGQLPPPDRWKGSLNPDRLEVQFEQEGPSLLMGMLIFGGYIDTRERTLQSLDATRIMIAAELFVIVNGRAPASLDELVPHILPTLPMDPVTGSPFRYKLLEDDPHGRPFLLYSIGADGVDNGGHYDPDSPWLGKRPDEAGFDVPLNLPRDE